MTTTTYLELEDQATGSNNNTWGDVLDANMAILEQAIARYTAIATTGGTTTLTSSQNRYPIIRLTGTLASNATITVKTQEKNWIVINNTTGAFTVTVKTSAGTGKTIPRGRAVKLYCDGTNVEYARDRDIPAAQAGGTVDAITATFEPPTTSAELQDGTLWIVEAAGANTSTTPTFNPDATGALTIKKYGGQALAAGDIRAAGHKLLLCYDATGGHVELLNPTVSLSGYAPLASPTFTGTPAAPTASAYTNTTQLATTANVYASVTITPVAYYTGSHTLTIDNAGRMLMMDSASGMNLTIPLNATVAFPTGTRIDIAQWNTGQVTVVATSGVYLLSSGSLVKTARIGAAASLIKMSTDAWLLTGELA